MYFISLFYDWKSSADVELLIICDIGLPNFHVIPAISVILCL